MSGLAIDGGKPSRSKLFSPWPFHEEDEIRAATEVLKSGRVNYWTGLEGRLFEQEFAQFVGVNYAIALANGTLALEAALVGVGIGPGDEVIVPSRTFIATASSVVMRGGRPIPVDVNPDTQNVTAEAIGNAISPRTKAIIVVHLAGLPCDMDPILDIAKAAGLSVIEDCAQAHGATYNGKQVGSLGDVAAFSFCQDKIMSTGGEGGMVTTNREEIWSKVWSFKDHGKNHAKVHQNLMSTGYRWVHDSFGTNWRMTEFQSAIGRVQLKKLNQWVAIRRENARVLTDRFSKLEALRLLNVSAHSRPSFYKFYAFVRPEHLRTNWNRDRIIGAICSEGIPCSSGICSEIYREGAFQHSYWAPSNRLAVAKELGETSLMFMVHPTLTQEEIDATCVVTERVMREATFLPV